MKPNFALSLSHNGIRLLHRVSGGWRLVGEADTEPDSLADELAVLRSTATLLEPGGLRCKVVIPDEQIRFMTIDTAGLSEADRRTAARAALEGATPYDVEDLVFDICADGDKTHVAAVARETLDEAEAFALEHRFHPVSFVAAPEQATFIGEPFFGETRGAAELIGPDQTLERDALPVTVSAPLPPPSEPDASHGDDGYDEEDATEPDVSFISRRTVPTFRTEVEQPVTASGGIAAETASVPGFADPAEAFESRHSPARSAPSGSDHNQKAATTNLPRGPSLSGEKERMAVFGARDASAAPDRTGSLIRVAAVVLVVILGVAAFASGLLGGGFSALFDRPSSQPPDVRFAAPPEPENQESNATIKPPTETVALTALDQDLTDEDAAVLDALRSPVLAEPELNQPPSLEDIQSSYAVTGIWPLAPEVPQPSALVDLDNFYIPSIDPIEQNFDAVALPQLKSFTSDLAFLAPANPAPAGTVFNLNDSGVVIPTPEGAMTPDGIMVFSGPPPVRQPDNLLRVEEPGEDLAVRILLAGFRPKQRPDDLIETTERATLSGLTRSELSLLRPRLRPVSAQENALAAASLVSVDGGGSNAALIQPRDENAFDGATARAVAASLRPDARPNDFSEIVARVQSQQQQRQTSPDPVATASVAPRAVAPKIPSSASTSKAATQRNAINLRQVNLIGVYGAPSNRRALVRLGNGRYQKVEVGDQIDGGRVSAIGDAELRYQKSGRSIVLKMPNG